LSKDYCIILFQAKGYEFLATDPLQRTILLLINLLPECGFTYLDMITGDYLQNVSNWIYEGMGFSADAGHKE
jgi:hypothetical protein